MTQGLENPSVRIVPWSAVSADDLRHWHAMWMQLKRPPDQAPNWALALIDGHELNRDNLMLCVAESEEEWALAWPFQVKPSAKPTGNASKELGPLQNVHCLHSGILSRLPDRQTVHLIINALISQPSLEWTCLEIRDLEEDSSLANAWLDAANEFKLPLVSARGDNPPYIDDPGAFDDYLSTRSTSFRKRTRRAVRELDTNPEYRLQLFTKPDEMPLLMKHILQIEHGSWKHDAQCAITSRPWEERFYRQLLGKFSREGTVVGAILFIDGKPAAHSIDLRHESRVYGLKSSFDRTFAEHRVGRKIMAAMAKHHFDGNCEEYDFLGTDDPFKQEWTCTARQHVSIRIYRSRFDYWWAGLRRLAARLRKLMYRHDGAKQPA